MRGETLAILVAVLLGTGCAGGGARRQVTPSVAEPVAQDTVVLEPIVMAEGDATPLSRFRLDVSAVPVPMATIPLDSAEPRRKVTDVEAQCLAARNAYLADLLDREADVLDVQRGVRATCSTQLVQQLLRLQAVQQRNDAAAGALTLLWRLLEAEAGDANIRQRLQELDALLADVQSLLDQGSLPPVSRDDLSSQRWKLVHRQLEVHAAVAELNQQLSRSLGLSAGEARLWPDVSLTVAAESVDESEEVSFALSNRADLIALRQVQCADPSSAAEATRKLLQLASPALGAAAGSCRPLLCLWGPSVCEEVFRSGQLDVLLREREGAVREATLRALADRQLRWAQIGATRQRLTLAEQQLVAARGQQRVVGEAIVRVREAELARLEVEQELLHDVVEYQLARVRLKQAQGLLATECGYSVAW